MKERTAIAIRKRLHQLRQEREWAQADSTEAFQQLAVMTAYAQRLKRRLAEEIAARTELELLVREAGLLPTVVEDRTCQA